MDDDGIWKDLEQVIRETFDDEEIELRREMTAASIDGWDSISNVELMVALENHFQIRFSTGELAGLADVGQLADLIAKRGR